MKYLFFKIVDLLLLFGILKIITLSIKNTFIILFFSTLIYYIINTLASIYLKNRLNYLYTFKYHKRLNKYELQYNPTFGFHWINKRKFINLREDALYKLKNKFSSSYIVGITMTINNINIENEFKLIKVYSNFHKFSYLLSNALLTFINLRNICTLTFTRKLFKMIFKNDLCEFLYASPR
jgi:hypothetical protein